MASTRRASTREGLTALAMTLYELADRLFGGRDDASPGSTTTMYATAVSASANGRVGIVIDGTVMAADDEDASITVDTVVSVSKGDRVILTLVDGHPTVTGVVGWGDGVAQDIADLQDSYDDADTAAEEARELAKQASEAAEATGQHFWSDDGGVHISDEKGKADGAHNVLLNSLGLLLRLAANNVAALTKGAVTFYDGSGNGEENVVAHFGTDGATVGRASSVHTIIKPGGMGIYDGAGNLLASFAGKLIELGRNSVDTVISLCGGKGSLSYGLLGTLTGLRIGSAESLFLESGGIIVIQTTAEASSFLRISKDSLQIGNARGAVDITEENIDNLIALVGTYEAKPVWCLYDKNSGDHYYTTSQKDRDEVKAAGWTDQGIAFYALG